MAMKIVISITTHFGNVILQFCHVHYLILRQGAFEYNFFPFPILYALVEDKFNLTNCLKCSKYINVQSFDAIPLGHSD